MSLARSCTRLAAGACMAVPLLASAACYQLFDKKDRLVLQSTNSPVDLSKSISEEVARLYPGHYFIMGASGACFEVNELDRPEVKLPAAPLNRGPIPLSGDPVATQRRKVSPDRNVAGGDDRPQAQAQAQTQPLPVRYFANCAEAKAAGRARIKKGEPEYRLKLDKDGDGVACE